MEGRGNQPPPSHTWSGSLIVDMLQEACPRHQIPEAVVLAWGEPILFFGRCLHREGLPYRSAKDVESSFRVPVYWARRTLQVEASSNTVQEGHWAIVDAVMEKKTKARGPGCPRGSGRAIQSSTSTCNINECNVCSVHSGGGRWCQQKRTSGIPRGSPSSGGGSSEWGSDQSCLCSSGGESSEWGSDQSSLCSIVMRASSSSNGSVHLGGGLWVKVNLPVFKDEKSKDTITYSSWEWDVAIFHWSGWDDQHLWPYIFCLLQGLPGEWARSLGEDVTLNGVL